MRELRRNKSALSSEVYITTEESTDVQMLTAWQCYCEKNTIESRCEKNVITTPLSCCKHLNNPILGAYMNSRERNHTSCKYIDTSYDRADTFRDCTDTSCNVFDISSIALTLPAASPRRREKKPLLKPTNSSTPSINPATLSSHHQIT
jgi:hypothetical protein